MFDDLEVDIVLPILESYESYNIDIIRLDIIREMENLEMKLNLLPNPTLMESAILLEDVAQIRQRISNGLQRLVETIKRLSSRFQRIALSLVARNKAWLNRVQTKIGPETVRDGYSYQTFPYWNTSAKLINYRIPELRLTDEDMMEALGSESDFREKYFDDLFIQRDGKSVYDPKQYFRGGTKRIIMNKNTVLSQASHMVNFVEDYTTHTKKVIDSNTKLTELLSRAAASIKTAPLQETSSILDTINMLLQENDTKPATSSQLEKEEEPGNEGPKDQTSGVRQVAASQQLYSRVCYGVNAARMAIMEECYNTYVKALSLAIATPKGKK